jgi:hypothetical protein
LRSITQVSLVPHALSAPLITTAPMPMKIGEITRLPEQDGAA